MPEQVELQTKPEQPVPDIAPYKPSQQTVDRILNNFTYHAPNDSQIKRYPIIRDAGKDLAMIIVNMAPESRERSLALTKLEEAIMWANAAIARNE